MVMLLDETKVNFFFNKLTSYIPFTSIQKRFLSSHYQIFILINQPGPISGHTLFMRFPWLWSLNSQVNQSQVNQSQVGKVDFQIQIQDLSLNFHHI